MEKTAVIAIRDSLLNNNDKNLRIVFDNGVNLSEIGDIVIWDDEKEIVTGFVTDSTSDGFIADKQIKIISSTYENIQFLMGNTDVKNLEAVINGLKTSINITDDQVKKIKEYFGKLLDPSYELKKKYYPNDIKRD